jgi:predicted nicotinamide N-methyase
MSAECRTFERLTSAFLGEFDLILGADICFWDDLSRQLRNLIRRARRGGAGRVLIADPGRPPFHALAEGCMERLEDVQRVEMRLRRPVRATGELLIVG